MKVQAIMEIKDVRAIKRLLVDRPRDRLLFIMGVNSGLRVQDILQLKIGDVLHVTEGDHILIRELKTGKDNVVVVNREIQAALKEFFGETAHDPNQYLFRSRKGQNQPLSTHAVTGMVKRWCADINLPGNYGAHTLRKSWCYHQRKNFGVSWELLAKRLNHATPAVTRAYLGVQAEEVEEVLLNNI